MASSTGLRILHISPRYAPAPGGVETFFAKASSGLAGKGHEVDVWTTDAATVDGFAGGGPRRAAGPREGRDGRLGAVEGGVRVRRFRVARVPARRAVLTAAHLLPFGRGWRSALQRWSPALPGLWAAVRRGGEGDRLDVVHAAGLPYSVFLWAGWRVARSAGARLVMSPFVHVGNTGDRRDRTAARYLSALNVSLLREADLVFAQTDGERERLVASGVEAGRVQVLGMAVDSADVTGGSRSRGRGRWSIGQGAFLVGQLANKSREKGTLDLLEAVDALNAAGEPVHVLLAGPDMPTFRRNGARYTGAPWLTVAGVLSDEERRDFYASIDAFALPSLVDSYGIVLLEAAANGVPAVAYRVGGPAEVLSHERTGLLVPPGDVAALRRALARLAADDSLRVSLGEAARIEVSGRPWARVVDALEAAYRVLVDAGPSAGAVRRWETCR
jgi:glycosyltransferase involved in cell wall biosynthesis